MEKEKASPSWSDPPSSQARREHSAVGERGRRSLGTLRMEMDIETEQKEAAKGDSRTVADGAGIRTGRGGNEGKGEAQGELIPQDEEFNGEEESNEIQ